ncbi:MAG: YdiU family protein [Acidimicrobiia bacterium]|nr:YdiU family protein [Acidimicrobiia bacterium]
MTDPTTAWPGLRSEFRDQLPELGVDWQPAEVPEPALVTLNVGLADELGLDPDALRAAHGVAVLAGNATPPGSQPIAMAYAGHQFGQYNPRLGDGRAVLLGELSDDTGRLVDVHQKGSGRTPFARGGDGKASIGPMLREFVMAEAMHAIGVPTTRALAVVTTGETVMRQRAEPGAVLTRTAASHIRVGTFEYAARLEDPTVGRRLLDHVIDRHHAEVRGDAQPVLAFLRAVVDAQAQLVSRWMLVGFIHGVMNTDNMAISGETIDYGPCAFMDHYDPATVFSSIDHGGRYAYGNQPVIAQWDLARLAETLLVIDDLDVDDATEVIHGFEDRYRHHWERGMAAKLGLTATQAGDEALFDELVQTLHGARLDLTTTFRQLASTLRGADDTAPALVEWVERWHRRLDDDGADRAATAATMDATNPVYVPRNHLVENALAAAEAGDLAPFHELLAAVTDPFTERTERQRYAEPAPGEFTDRYQTFCGT